MVSRGLPGNPVVKTMFFQFRGCGFNPWLGTCYSQKKKKESKLKINKTFFKKSNDKHKQIAKHIV